MPEPQDRTRVCPTRVDHAPVLFTHRVSEGRCQDRQRGRYHKCYTCAFRNEYVALHGPPEEARRPKPVEVAERRALAAGPRVRAV